MNVSIVIPAYNAAETVADTLESVLSQTYPNWEAIVVDDGSIDTTAEIAGNFVERDARIRMISQPNGGEAAARNAGIGLARNDWLLFLDADDWISPVYLERLTAELTSDPVLDAVHCGYARVAYDGTLVVEKYQPPSGDMFPTLARRSAFPVHACIVRKSLVEAVGRFDTSLRTSPDWDLWQRIARTGARFGAVRELLAFYRMSPRSASLDALQLFKDDLRVLRQGHAPDARVPNPHPDYAKGMPESGIQTQEFYLLSWCAGLLLGAGKDARPLLEMVTEGHYRELYPDGVAESIFAAAILPTCKPPHAWVTLWPTVEHHLDEFLLALEKQSMAPDLAHRTLMSLKEMVLKHSPTWQAIIEEREHVIEEEKRLVEQLRQSKALLEEERSNWQRLAEEREQVIEEEKRLVEQLRQSKALLEEERDNWERLAKEGQQTINEQNLRIERLEESVEERVQVIRNLKASIEGLESAKALLEIENRRVLRSSEQRLGNFLLNRMRMRVPFERAQQFWVDFSHWLIIKGLTVRRWALAARAGRRRLLTTACTNFPIYSQTFVYQEISQLARQGFDVQLIYSKLNPRDYLHEQFANLWKAKRRLILHHKVQERDFAHYYARFPDKVKGLIYRLCDASGFSRNDLVHHDNFLQAFSFTRVVEAYRPHYLHSYFFYDRSLMALVASYLLNIPRGISCYADHLLKDYELKVIPLHLELCDIIIATSERVKHELLEIAPQTNPARILVKANAINIEHFPFLERTEPEANAPFRLVCVSRIDPKKGLLYLVEAVAILRERGLNVELHLVGAHDPGIPSSQECKSRLDQRISELNLWGTVHLEGRQNEQGVLHFLGLAHLFVAPFVKTDFGDKDGIPTALLEAMSTGLPTVATDAGSITEVIDGGREGILVPQCDALALANAVETLLRDRARRLRMGRQAAEKVYHRFDVRTCESLFHERVQKVIEARRRHLEVDVEQVAVAR